MTTAAPDSQTIQAPLELFHQGRYQEMESLAHAITRQFPQYGLGWKLLGVAIKKQGRDAEALAPMQQAVALLPNDADTHNNLGVILKAQHRLADAEACFRQALALNPELADFHLNLGNTLKEQHRLAEAEACYNRILALKPDSLDAHVNLGTLFLKQNRQAEAEVCYRQALTLMPNLAEIHFNLGNLFKRQERLAEAEASYGHALKIKPDFLDALTNLGGLFLEQERLAEAEACFHRVLAIQADFAAAHINLTTLFLRQNRLPEAEIHGRRALELEPNHVTALQNLGKILADLGRHDESVASYRRALALTPLALDPHNYKNDIFYNVQEGKDARLIQGVHGVVALVQPQGIFTGDNLVAWGRNLSFLDDQRFMAAVEKNGCDENDRAIIWRTYTLCWAAEQGLRREGDFVECGCYRGYSARVIADYLDVGRADGDKSFWIYDLFAHKSDDPHHAMPGHGSGMFEWVQKRFADLPKVQVVRGRVPDILAERSPEKISFLHIDMNNVDAEIGALEVLFDRVVPGALVLFDDYGWRGYRAQKIAEDGWLARRGYRILELPTGQGWLIK